MIYKKLGNLTVPAIGQGTQGIHDPAIIKHGIDLGMTLIDTAEIYQNEEVIGQAIKGVRDKVFISTKFSPEHNGYYNILRACEGSLKRLGTDYIDLYSLHWPHPKYPLEDSINAIFKLVTDGKVRNIGVCNLSYSQLQGCQEVIPDCLQVEYNLFDRFIEDTILPYCESHNMAVIAYSPLRYIDQLRPSGRLWLEDIAFVHRASRHQLALNWITSQMAVIAIPKSKDANHQRLNATATDFELSGKELKGIDSLFPTEIVYIKPDAIKISRVGKFPQTLEEAKINITNFVPSPEELAQDIDDIKPIRVEYIGDKIELVEGGLRYWAWVIKNGDKPIPAIIRENISPNWG